MPLALTRPSRARRKNSSKKSSMPAPGVKVMRTRAPGITVRCPGVGGAHRHRDGFLWTADRLLTTASHQDVALEDPEPLLLRTMDVLRRQECLRSQLEVQLGEGTARLLARADKGDPLASDRVLDDIACADHLRNLTASCAAERWLLRSEVWAGQRLALTGSQRLPLVLDVSRATARLVLHLADDLRTSSEQGC